MSWLCIKPNTSCRASNLIFIEAAEIDHESLYSCPGCGKTTLLSILSGSVSSLSGSSRVYGNITLDGQTRKAWASRLVAYVPQFDFLLPTLTVAETLRYSALLRLPKDTQGPEVQVRRPPWPHQCRSQMDPPHLVRWDVFRSIAGACATVLSMK